jgi:uncharacterized protein YfaS (alpha-2-macroglobulin family)
MMPRAVTEMLYAVAALLCTCMKRFMRNWNWIWVVGLLAFAMCTQVVAGPRDAQWRKVDEAVQKGLPKTALEELQPILDAALKEKAYGEAAKAIAKKISLEGEIQGNKPEEKITRMQSEIAKAPKEIVPLLDTILAEWYWQYFQMNRWRFMQRTATAEQPGKDFTTWDLKRLFAEIDTQFQKALAASDMLKKIPIGAYDDLLVKGTLPDKYRPTLYDFIAHEALAFYTSAEQAGAKPEDAFEISADSPIFDEAEKFMVWKPTATDTNSPAVRAMTIYQDLMRFHKADAEPTAFVDVDLERLVYGNNAAVGEEKGNRFQAALDRLINKWGDHEVSAEASFHLATLLQQEGKLVDARNAALRAVNAFPNSAGGKECRNLIAGIEAKESRIVTERVWNQPMPKIQVSYRNVTKVYFRAVSYDWKLFLERNHSRPESLNDNERKELLQKQPTLEWSADLPPTTDYKESLIELPGPDKLKPGFYFILASHDPAFGGNDNVVSYCDVWVSTLSLITRSTQGGIEGIVLNAVSGEPLAGAEVNAWHLDNRGNRVADPVKTTDENGFFSLSVPEYRSYVFLVQHQGQQLGTMEKSTYYNEERERPFEQTVFFTDRAIYRPGQTIRYKGISLRIDQKGNNYQLLKGRALKVIFSDPNGKEITRQSVQCNDYGSFSGSFTAPRDRLMGMMQIHIERGPVGQANFNVEEYKRPKFQVTLDAPKEAPKLNQKVSLQGHAMSYTGAAVDGAKVQFRVVREVQYPIWWGYYSWRRPMPNESSQEIVHGTIKTEVDGSFKVEFAARPDLSVPEKDEPTFRFKVYADVTDSAGETRSADTTVNAGYTALKAAMTADEWQTAEKPVDILVKATSLDDQGQIAEGVVKVYRLKQPEKVQRAPLKEYEPYWLRSGTATNVDLSDPKSWILGEMVLEKGFTTGTNGEAQVSTKLETGPYRAMLETQDRFGKRVTAMLPIMVLDPKATKLAIKVPNLVTAPSWTVEPGAELMALWGTGYDEGRALVEVEHRNKIIRRYWTKPGQTQSLIKQAVDEEMRGGFTLHVTQVRENRAYVESKRVDVPWSNQELKVSWEHFTSKMQPNQRETWTAVIKGPNAQKAVAEMVATLYDESLDALRPMEWMKEFSFFYQDQSMRQATFENVQQVFQGIKGNWRRDYIQVERSYRSFPPELTWYGNHLLVSRNFIAGTYFTGISRQASIAPASPAPEQMAEMPATALGAVPKMARMAKESLADASTGLPASIGLASKADIGGELEGKPKVDLSKVAARKNLNETAFFFPQLTSDSNGVVRMTFTMPEALTQWKFLSFAHDKELRSGFLEGKTVTAKDLMVQPNPPRFLREGDVLEFTVKVLNQTTNRQTGKVRLTFNQALNDKPADQLLGNTKPELDFDIPAKESRSYSWRIKVLDGIGFLSYKAVGSTGTVSDGEEGYLPVLSRRILVTESLPLPIRGPATKKFDFAKLEKSGGSDTLRSQSLTVQMASNPAWYAVMALPYLMEFPHECSEQTFNRFYANALARSIANSDPKIQRVFQQWKGTATLESPLEKNQDLKSVAVEETPWLRQAESESQARKNIGILFDENRLNSETASVLQKLQQMQLPEGLWPWFPGGREDEYITLYITTGFGRLRRLGVDLDVSPAVRSLQKLDAWVDEQYREILKYGRPNENHLSSTIAFYLYGRSFFLKDRPIDAAHQEAVNYFLGQARKYWLEMGNRQSQGHLALALLRFGDAKTPKDIMKSIKEHSVSNEEMGMFWRDTELSWWWYRAPIETQALMIEAFDEVMQDAKSVEDCKVWLLKQKQTQDWKTTKATADAVYALLLRGTNLLASDALVEVSLGGKTIRPEKVEAGTGFYEQKFTGPEIKPKMGEIVVKKVDSGVAWGGVHWQYLEDVSKVTPHEGTPLKLNKALFVKRNTARGPVLEPLKGGVNIGDELVVRIELRTDRDMEYVHMKDQRGSGLEPVNVLSQYKYQDGLAYYESTRDTASHFFIDYLPKGVYVFEYSARVVHKGQYQSGMAEIQCMYAPEFNSHSQSYEIVVK